VRLSLRGPKPYPKQELMITCPADEMLIGGAKGSGKTYGLSIAIIIWAIKYPGVTIGVFRKSLPELKDSIIKNTRNIIPPEFFVDRISENKFIFHNGSTILFRHLETDKDLAKYLGQEYEIIVVDEAGQLTEYQLTNLSTCNRTTKVIPNFKPFIVYLTNPVGPAKGYLKRRFVDNKEPYKMHVTPETKHMLPEDHKYLTFIPATLKDNPELMKTGYMAQLLKLPPELQAAYIDGDWESRIGTFFPSWNEALHVIPKYTPKDTDELFIACDWGTNKPFAIGWFALTVNNTMIMYREYYGMLQDQPDTGVDMTAKQVAKQIIKKSPNNEEYRHMILDNACWAKDGQGGSVYEYFQKTLRPRRISVIPSKKGRINGWSNMKVWLEENPKTKMPSFVVTRNCFSTRRTLPDLVYSDSKEMDLNTKQEDHLADMIQYMLSSRPKIKSNNTDTEYEDSQWGSYMERNFPEDNI